MKGQENLRPVRTKEEARERGRNGGLKSGKARKKKRMVKDILETLLSTKPTDKQIKSIQKIFPGVDLETLEDVLNLSMIKEGIKGNVKAYNAVYDRKEGRPQQTIKGDIEIRRPSEERQKELDKILERENQSFDDEKNE